VYVCVCVCLSSHNSGMGRVIVQNFGVAPGHPGDGFRHKKFVGHRLGAGKLTILGRG